MYKLKTKSANKYILVNKHPHTKEEREREKKKKKRERERERNISCGPIAPLPLWTKPNIGITSRIFGCLKLKLHSFLPLSLHHGFTVHAFISLSTSQNPQKCKTKSIMGSKSSKENNNLLQIQDV